MQAQTSFAPGQVSDTPQLKRVCLALGMNIHSRKPVLRHWVEDLQVVEADDVHIYFRSGKGRAAVSRRYHLHPLQPENARPPHGEAWMCFSTDFGKREKKLFSPDMSDQLLQYTHEYCLAGYEDQLLKQVLVSYEQALKKGAAFHLACIDQIQAVTDSIAN